MKLIKRPSKKQLRTVFKRAGSWWKYALTLNNADIDSCVEKAHTKQELKQELSRTGKSHAKAICQLGVQMPVAFGVSLIPAYIVYLTALPSAFTFVAFMTSFLVLSQRVIRKVSTTTDAENAFKRKQNKMMKRLAQPPKRLERKG